MQGAPPRADAALQHSSVAAEAQGAPKPVKQAGRTARPYRILFVFPEEDEHAARAIAGRIGRRTFSPFFCSIDRSNTTGNRGRSIPVGAPLPADPKTGDFLRCAISLAQQLRIRNIDVVHALGGAANLVTRISARLTRNRPAVILACASNRLDNAHNPSRLEWWTRKWADRFIVSSVETRQALIENEGLPEGNIAIIGNVGSTAAEYAREHAHIYSILAADRRRRIRLRGRLNRRPVF